MPEQIRIVINDDKAALFRAFMAEAANANYTIVEEAPSLPRHASGINFTSFTLETDEGWRFFYLGANWADYERKGGQARG